MGNLFTLLNAFEGSQINMFNDKSRETTIEMYFYLESEGLLEIILN